MMISSKKYIGEWQDKTYEGCIAERDSLISSIRQFEQGKFNREDLLCKPSPDTIYQCELEYLSEICRLIVRKYQSAMWDE